MRLLLDLGNSRLKWALWDGQVLSARGAAAWDQGPLRDVVLPQWTAMPDISTIWQASVVDAAREAQLQEILDTRFGLAPKPVVTQAAACGVRIAYAQPEQLGVDRFLSLIAAWAAGHAPCLLVTCGTAITVDALDAAGRHLGGLIAPGPDHMHEILLATTVQVRPRQEGQLLDLAANTADAVTSGVWQAAVGLVEHSQKYLQSSWGNTPKLLVAGGGGERLRSLLGPTAEPFSGAVLMGLAHYLAGAESSA